MSGPPVRPGIVKALYSLLRTIYQHPFNRQRPVFALGRLIRWQFDKRFRKGNYFTYPFWGDRKLACFPDSLETMWVVYNYVMDWEEFNFIRSYLRNGSCAFDIGANIGIYTIWFSRFTGNGKIFSFEPDPENYNRCKQQIEINHLKHIRLEQCALGDHQGQMKLSQEKDLENHLIPTDDSNENFITVPVIQLDEYCRQNSLPKIDYLKIDVEGAELFVLKGARELLSRKCINVIQFELNDKVDAFGIEKQTVVKFLRNLGYVICRYDVRKNILYPVAADSDDSQNLFAVFNIQMINALLLRQA